MTGHFSYRVYESDHSQSIAPTTFRTGPRPAKERGFFGFAVLVLVVVAVIGTAGFAGQRMLDAELARSPRLANGGGPAATPNPSPFAMSLVAPATPDPTPAAPTSVTATPVQATTVAATPESSASRLRRKLQHRRPTAPNAPAPGVSSGLPSERGAVASPNAPADPPPNPF